MSFAEVFLATVFGTLWCSFLGLPFALLPAGFVAILLKAEKREWKVIHKGDVVGDSVPVWKLGLLGGIGGAFAAVSSLLVGEWWICLSEHQLCHDGQGGIALIFTVPLLVTFGAALSLAWTWISLGIPAGNAFTSVLRCSGGMRWLNWTVAVVEAALFWMFMAYGAYLLILR